MAVEDYLIWNTPGGTDPGMSYSSLAMRKRIAERLMSQRRPFPKTKGEGMTYLGESIGEGLQMMQLNAQERAYQKQLNQTRQDMRKDAGQYYGQPSGTPQQDPEKSVIYNPPGAAGAPGPTGAAGTGAGTMEDPRVVKTIPTGPVVETPEEPAAPPPVDVVSGDQADSPLDVLANPSPAPDVQSAATQPPDTGESWSPDEQASVKSDRGQLSPEAIDAYQSRQEKSTPVYPASEFNPIDAQAPEKPLSSLPPIGAQSSNARDSISKALMAQAGDGAGMSAMAQGSEQDAMPVYEPATPEPAPGIPLPPGDPRKPGGVRYEMDKVFDRNPDVTPEMRGGIKWGVKDESSFNPFMRQLNDQKDFGGEARHGHGLLSEGGDEWLKYQDWLKQNYPDATSGGTSVKQQMEFTLDRLRDPQYRQTWDRMQSAQTPGQAADALTRGYLKPAQQYQEARGAAYRGPEPSYDSGDRQRFDPTSEGTMLAMGGRMGEGPGAGVGGEVARGPQEDQTQYAFGVTPDQQPQPTQGDEQDARLADVTGTRPGTNKPFFATAALGRAGVPPEGPAAGGGQDSPVGEDTRRTLDERRNGITNRLLPPPPAVPTPPPVGPGSSGSMGEQPTMSDISPAPDPLRAGQQYAQAQAQGQLQAPPPSQGFQPQQSPLSPDGFQPRGTPITVYGGKTPDPLDPRPETPSAGAENPLTPIPIRRPLTPPEYPELMKIHPLELRADQFAATSDDPNIKADATEMKRQGGIMREQENARRLSLYNDRIKAYEEQQKEERARFSPKGQAEQKKLELEIQEKRNAVMLASRYGGLRPEFLEEAVKKEQEKVGNVASGIQSVRNAREALDKGMFTGAFAETDLGIAKLMQYMGYPKDPRINNTENFKAMIKPLVAQSRQALVGGANISNSDIALAAEAAGGNITFDEQSIRAVIGALERMSVAQAINYQGKLLGLSGGDPTAVTTMQAAFGLPMHNIVPAEAIQRLREHANNPDARAQFDRAYKTPGLANRILER